MHFDLALISLVSLIVSWCDVVKLQILLQIKPRPLEISSMPWISYGKQQKAPEWFGIIYQLDTWSIEFV